MDTLSIEDLQGCHSRAMMLAAQNIISFERCKVEADDQRPCTIYRYSRDANGEIQCVEVGKAYIGEIVDCGPPPEPEPRTENWVTFPFPV